MDVEEHVLLVRVRNIQPRGDRFAVGAERICTFFKEDFGNGPRTCETLSGLLADKRWAIEANALEREAASAESVVLSPEPPFHNSEDEDHLELAGSNPEPVLATQEMVAAHEAVALNVEQASHCDLVLGNTEQVIPKPQPKVPNLAPARRSFGLPLTLAAALVLLVFAGAISLKLRPRHASPVVALASATAQLSSSPNSKPAIAPSPPSPIPIPAQQGPTQAGSVAGFHHVRVNFLDSTWVTASADGKALLGLGRMYGKNDSFEFDYSKTSFLHLGNANGVQIVTDGKPIRLAEPHGVTQVLQLTPSGSSLLPWTKDDARPSF